MKRVLVLVYIGISCLDAFTVHVGTIPSRRRTISSSTLYGIRSGLRRILPHRWFQSTSTRVDAPTQRTTSDRVPVYDTTVATVDPAIPTTIPTHETPHVAPTRLVTSHNRIIEPEQTRASPQRFNVMLPSNSATLLRAKTAASTSHVSLYELPDHSSRAGNLTALEQEFRDMIAYFANYSEADLLSIADPRKRALFEGVAASSYTRPVYRAFEILFEDLLPLRMAGRLIFGKLKQFMASSLEQRRAEIDLVVDRTGLVNDTQQMEEIRLMFVSTASHLNGDSWLTLDQMAETGIITATATDVLGFESAEKLFQELDRTQSGRLTFLDLMSGLWDLSNELCGLEQCNPQVVLHNLLVELNEHPPPPADFNARLDAKRRQYSLRYDEMVASFVQWKDLVPSSSTNESRRMQVVRGCFVGAENPKVVNALRIVYVDYAGLRVAGDIIFKLVSTLLRR